jgi:hypothetical protein
MSEAEKRREEKRREERKSKQLQPQFSSGNA